MVLRRCSICDRNFTKAEHYLRHQRSHTKERPYECVTCKKRFSRSDVLFRHSKLHNQQTPDGRGESSNPSSHVEHVSPMRPVAEEHMASQMSFKSGDRPVFIQELREQTYGDAQAVHSRQMSIPDIALGHQYHMTPQQLAPISQLTTTQTYRTSGFSPAQEYPPNTTTPMMQSHAYDPQLMPMDQSHIDTMASGGFGAFQGSSSGQPYDMLHFWLSQADNELNYVPLVLPDIGNTPYTPEAIDNVAPFPLKRATTSETSETTSTSNIPNERFARVENCWLAKSNAKHRLASSLWLDIARSPGPNLFATGSPQPREGTQNRWGLNSETRSRLENEFGVHLSRRSAPGQSNVQRSTNLAVPPIEVLDICLDMYFRRFHPISPLVHGPTFDASTVPPALLYAMCLLGLSALESSNGGNFINHSFSILLRKVHNDLATNAIAPRAPHKQLALFATGFLTLSLAALSGDKDRLAQSQMLYASLIASVQRQGLFSVEDMHLEEILQDITDENQRWLAWSRIESAKRLIVALITSDWWFSTNSSVHPIIRPETLQICLPCDDVLFRAEGATRWKQLQQAGKKPYLPMIRPRTFNLEGALDPVILLDPPLDAPGQFTLLSTLKLCFCDAQHRHFLPSDDWDRHDHLIPWETFQDDYRARSLVQTAISLAPLVMGTPRTADLNSMVLWHNICLTLNANIQIFELAAGREGAGPAGKALTDVADWAQTPSARRACIHAAHTFKLFNNRKVSESITLNSMSSLFCSALVLGLYLFTVQAEPNHASRPPFELLDDVDWTVVGNAGMADGSPENSPGMMFESAHASNLARVFIEKGGPVSLGGVIASGGYQSARRILLDFAHLMDGIGAWKPRTLSRILHIMSDVLEESM